MKKLGRITLNIMILAALIVLHSCQKEELLPEFTESADDGMSLKSKTMNTFYSKTIPVGNGVARAWIQVTKEGDPLAVGLNLSGKALENLPDEHQVWVLEFPKNKGANFYTHMLFDWNPGGHEPPGVYDLPHFDFHFYTIPIEERLAIPGEPFPYFDDRPATQYIPGGYILLPGLIPQMGAHWALASSPELQDPQVDIFKKTFIWGSYEGEFIFWEPMITRQYLLSQPDEIIEIPQPEAYARDGWYATHYQISYSTNPDEYTIALLNLTFHEGQ